MFISRILAGRRKPLFFHNANLKKTPTKQIYCPSILIKKEVGRKSISFPPPGAAVWPEVAFCSAVFIRAVYHSPARSLWPLLRSELSAEQLHPPVPGSRMDPIDRSSLC